MGLPEFTPVKNYKFLPGDPEMYNGDPVAKSLIVQRGPRRKIFDFVMGLMSGVSGLEGEI